MTQLIMLKPELADLPMRTTASACRPASNEDAAELADLLSSAFPEMSWDADRVMLDLLGNREITQTLVAVGDGRITGTASARRAPAFPQHGYIHWVGIHPEHRGNGSFQALMTGVLQHISDTGISTAILETDDDRLPAIAAYLAIGFVPQFPCTDHLVRWSRIFVNLAQHRKLNRK